MLVTTKINKLNDKLESKNKMTQLGLNIFCIFKFLNFFWYFWIFDNRKIKCRNINDWKIKIDKNKCEKLDVRIRQVYQIVYQVIKW